MLDDDKVEIPLAPLGVRIVAGINFFVMFVIAFTGGILAEYALGLPDAFEELLLLEPITYWNFLVQLRIGGLTPVTLTFGLFFVGSVVAIVGLIGMVVALGTAYRKWWAIPLGVAVSICSIAGSISAYIIEQISPAVAITGPGGLLGIGLSIFFGILALNILFAGAFLLWQINELPPYQATVGRFVLVWNLDAICLYLTVLIFPGIAIVSLTGDFLTIFGVAYIIVAIISLLNFIVRPFIIRAVAETARWWLGFAISFILIIIANAVILFYISFLIPGFIVAGIIPAVAASFILSAVNSIFISLVGLDDDASFFDRIIRYQLVKEFGEVSSQTPGLVAIEIDGLGYLALQEAIRRGYMPTVLKLLASGSHQVAQWDCGIPSMTSSCQAGILHGNNEDIPAFRWYEKREKRMVISNSPSDAKYIDEKVSSGNGILRNGGSSISNLISGDADYSFFTMSTLTEVDTKAGRRRSEDLYYFLLNPYALNRSIIYTIWDALVELGQIIKQTVTRRKPRMNRLAHGYPFVRAATNIFMRDIATGMVAQDILRGSPAIYATYLGYDEIAHHSGPFTKDALKALQGIDKQIRRILHIIEEHAPRPYTFFLLADHGQSVGWTFKQRYHETIKELIARLLEGRAHVGEVTAEDAHRGYISGLVADLNDGEQIVSGKGKKDRIIRRSKRFLRQPAAKKVPAEPEVTPIEHDVIVCPSGNLAQIYFNFIQERITLEELETKYTGFLADLVAHDGVGLLIVMDANEGPVALGKQGAVILRTGQVRGTNPLSAYGREKVRVKQLLRLAEFSHCGDLVLISPVYPDGSVAAYEELIGNHGGLGGPQTEPFLLFPADMDINANEIINAYQIFEILNSRREK